MAKGGLGRGLESLFSSYKNIDVQENVSRETLKDENGIKTISISLIDPNKEQPRKKFEEEPLQELANSIKLHGVLQPILVVERNGRYLIVAGERRWRASKIAGLKEIPCIVGEFSNSEIKEISIIENLQRKDLTPIEEAKAIKELIDEFGWTQEVVAERLGKSRPAISNTLRLLQLAPEVIQMIEEGKLSAGHAKSLVVINDHSAQIKLAKQVAERKLTVRDLEQAVKTTKKGKNNVVAGKISNEFHELIMDMQRVFGTKVFMVGSENRGRIYIDYFNKDDLDRLYDIVQTLKLKY
ncbi:MAG: ParB/RepB/Spo0J family partition protein [Clostridiales bacterium]|nr:ParB/RepB/Spo0J family partition protein [Clostridiales bacterium]